MFHDELNSRVICNPHHLLPAGKQVQVTARFKTYIFKNEAVPVFVWSLLFYMIDVTSALFQRVGLRLATATELFDLRFREYVLLFSP